MPTMDVFAFRDELVAEYSRSSQSFTRFRAEDIARAADAAYVPGHCGLGCLLDARRNKGAIGRDSPCAEVHDEQVSDSYRSGR